MKRKRGGRWKNIRKEKEYKFCELRSDIKVDIIFKKVKKGQIR